MDDTQEQYAAEAGVVETTGFKPVKKSKAEIREEKNAQEFAEQRGYLEEAKAAEVFYDGAAYWSKLTDGRWVPNKKEDTQDNLMFQHNISKPSLIAEVLFHWRDRNRIDGASPFIHNKNTVVTDQNGIWLNTTRRLLLQPAKEDGPFPWLDEYFKKSWDPAHPEQREHFLAWFKRLYQSAYNGELKSGHAVIIAGPVGTGKTLISRKVIGAALGGFTDAADYLLSKTGFNKEAAETAVWSIDDNRGGATWEKHDELSNSIKRYVANPQIPYHPKFKDATTIAWRGRIILTCNLDEKSLTILPEVDESIQEKLMMFQQGDWRPCFKNVEAVIAQELPYFLRWLLNWTPEKVDMDSDERFGVPFFHHPELLFASRAAAAPAQLEEMLDYSIPRGLANDKKETERWMTATEITKMIEDAGLRSGLSKFAGNRMGIALSKVGKRLILDTKKVDGIKHYLLNLKRP